MAAVSVFLSFVPSQILKRKTRHSREIILVQSGEVQTIVNARGFSCLFGQFALT